MNKTITSNRLLARAALGFGSVCLAVLLGACGAPPESGVETGVDESAGIAPQGFTCPTGTPGVCCFSGPNEDLTSMGTCGSDLYHQEGCRGTVGGYGNLAQPYEANESHGDYYWYYIVCPSGFSIPSSCTGNVEKKPDLVCGGETPPGGYVNVLVDPNCPNGGCKAY